MVGGGTGLRWRRGGRMIVVFGTTQVRAVVVFVVVGGVEAGVVG